MTKRSKPGDSPGAGIGKSKPKTAGKKSTPQLTATPVPSSAKKTGDQPTGPAKKTGDQPAGPAQAVAPGGGVATGPAAGSPRPAHSRAPGTKEVIPFGWKVVGQSGGVALILFKSIERQDAEAHYERLAAEGYYQKLAIMENNAVVRQPKGTPRPVFTSAKFSMAKNKKTTTGSKAKASGSRMKVSASPSKAPARRAALPTTKGTTKAKAKAVAKSSTKRSATKKAPTKKAATKKAVAKAKARPKSTKKTPAKRR